MLLTNVKSRLLLPPPPVTAEDKAVGVAVACSSLAITIMLIYGTARGRPGYIMPFFCLQAFDFCISCLTVVGYLSYMPDIKQWIKSQVSSCIHSF